VPYKTTTALGFTVYGLTSARYRSLVFEPVYRPSYFPYRLGLRMPSASTDVVIWSPVSEMMAK